MTDQNTFMETVRSVAEIIRTSGEPLSEEEILAYFEDMELDDNQKSLVLEYLKNPQSEEHRIKIIHTFAVQKVPLRTRRYER